MRVEFTTFFFFFTLFSMKALFAGFKVKIDRGQQNSLTVSSLSFLFFSKWQIGQEPMRPTCVRQDAGNGTAKFKQNLAKFDWHNVAISVVIWAGVDYSSVLRQMDPCGFIQSGLEFIKKKEWNQLTWLTFGRKNGWKSTECIFFFLYNPDLLSIIFVCWYLI